MLKDNWKRLLITTALLPCLAGCGYHGARNLEVTRISNIAEDTAWIADEIDIPDRPLTIDDLVALALERNLDLVVQQQNVAIQHEIATGQKLQMLPNLLVSTEISQRNNSPGSSSASLVPGIPPAPPSVSSNRHVFRWDATLTWNLIDFGVSYFRYRQEVNKTLMKALEYRRQEQNLIFEVVQAYWRAVVMQLAMKEGVALVNEAREQVHSLNKFIGSRIISTMEGYKQESRLIALQNSIKDFEKEFHKSFYELKYKVGLPATANFKLFIPEMIPIEIGYNVEQLAEYALLNRPELFSGDVEEQVHFDEVRASLIQLFPGVSLFGSEFYDRNTFLLNNNWLVAGVRAGWGLLSIPQRIQDADIARSRGKLTRLNRITLSIGILSQVYISWLLYRDLQEEYDLAYEQYIVNKKIVYSGFQQVKVGKMHNGILIGLQADLLDSKVHMMKIYADMQAALEQLNNAMGIPLFLSRGEVFCAPVCATHLLEGEGICNDPNQYCESL